jgi:hypothetical protein
MDKESICVSLIIVYMNKIILEKLFCRKNDFMYLGKRIKQKV